jgi:tetratricopeptide (TPR) repeat protein
VNVSTDLGIAYYYMNEADKALQQFDRSLAIDPKHAKTLLNIGIVRAFGKQDLKGAAEAWQRVLAVAPGTEEARAARQALEGVKAAHPDGDKK